MKKLFIIGLLATLIIAIGSYFLLSLNNYDKSKRLQVAFYRNSTEYKAYVFIIKDNRNLEVYIGKNNNYNMIKKNFLKSIESYEVRKLTKTEYTNIIHLADKVYITNKKIKYNPSLDGYDLSMYYKRNLYRVDFNDGYNNKDIVALIDTIISYSPIDIDLSIYGLNKKD